MNTYDVGDQVRLAVTFTDEDGNAADPTVITVKYISPLGTVTERTYEDDPAVVRDGTGQYSTDFVANRAGGWHYRWQSSGAITAAAEGQFQVRRSAFQ